MNDTLKTEVIAAAPPLRESIWKNLSLKVHAFDLILYCFILALATSGMGSNIFGFPLFTDVSTLFIYLALLIQYLSGNLRLPKILILIYAGIVVQTFLINLFHIPLASTVKHFLGLIVFSISTFSFVSVYRDRILKMAQVYYYFTFGLACLAILQTLLFVLLGFSFLPQSMISGKPISGGRFSFTPEILDSIPRAIGLSSEPAHFAILLLPGVFIALLVLVGKGEPLGILNKKIASAILVGFVLSFSLVGYFGLLLCLISIFSSNLKGNTLQKVSIMLFIGGAFYFIAQTNLMSKVTTLPKMFTNVSGFQYTSSDLTGFALASNMIVAREGLISSHYLGTGINTHQQTYDRVIYRLFSNSQVVMELNKENAGSMFIRLPSEFGLPGLLAFVFFLYRHRLGKKQKSALNYINSLCLVILISYSARNGSYLSTYLWLFLAIYYYTFIVENNPDDSDQPAIEQTT